MKIATWNINSVRLRQGRVLAFLKQAQPDVLCLQETKVQDADFPLEAFQAAGYTHSVFSGEKSYNGVAILSRTPLRKVETLHWAGKHDKRHLFAELQNGLLLHNFYVPAGGDVPDRHENPKFAHKLDFVAEMYRHFMRRGSIYAPLVLVGDLNIAPQEHDVWSHKQLVNVVSHTPVEVEALTKLQESMEWIDTSRHFEPSPKKLYSWWSYRNQDWRKSDRGRRLDHIWVTPALKKQLTASTIFKDERDGALPSDHVPVMLELNI